MLSLLDDRFAPMTWSIGFLEASIGAVSTALTAWRERLYGACEVRDLAFPDSLGQLEPLTTAARPRELLVEAGAWTAYFDCGLRGTDAEPVIGHLSQTMGCTGLCVAAVPDLVGTPGAPEAPFGAIEFILLGPLPTDWLNYVRSIAATHQDSRWEFTATGTVQPYEDLAAYRRRRVVDRFTPQMLAAYCAELGVRPFDASFYGPRSLLLTSPTPGVENGMVVSLAEAQRLQGIRRPG